MEIGILALQGGFYAHGNSLKKIGISPVYVKKKQDLRGLCGLILPGGESSTHIKLLAQNSLDQQIVDFQQKGFPIFGTCAGLILLSANTGQICQFSFGFLPVTIERNAYGSQKESFTEDVPISLLGAPDFPCVFIRAPKISVVDETTEVLASYNSSPILIRQNKILGATFHPELTEDNRIHQLFIEMCEETQQYDF